MGVMDGSIVGIAVGMMEGLIEGIAVGEYDGYADGFEDIVGIIEGIQVAVASLII